MNLSVRLAHYFKPSTIATSTRKFFKHLALYLFTDFKLDIQISKNGYKSDNYYKVQSLVLSLEQYYIFTLNSTRGRAMRKIGAALENFKRVRAGGCARPRAPKGQNIFLQAPFCFFLKNKKKAHTIKVAGIAPITELTEEAKASITKANSTPIYIYDNEKLVYRGAAPAPHSCALYNLRCVKKPPKKPSATSRRRLISVAAPKILRGFARPPAPNIFYRRFDFVLFVLFKKRSAFDFYNPVLHN